MFYHDLETEEHGARLARKWRLVRSLMGKAWDFSGEFRERLEGAGITLRDLDSPEAFASVPPLRKKNLPGLQERHGLEWLLTCELGRLRHIYLSPGPLFDPEGPGPDHWGWAEALFAAGFRPGDLVQMTFSYHLTPAGLMFEEPLREIGCTIIPAGPGAVPAQVELLRRLPVTGFVGMASFLRAIGDRALSQGLDPRQDFHLRTAFVAAERLNEDLRSDLEDLFGAVICQGYGTADVGAVAYECPEQEGMHVSSHCYVEICDPASGRPVDLGEVGEVVVTAFNPDYPLIRLATGDLSRLVPEPCPCGRTALRLAGILGRSDDTAKVKGQFIYPEQAARVVSAFPQIRRWQIVIENPGGKDQLTVRLLAAEGLSEAAFAAAFQGEMRLRPQVVCVGPEDLAEDAPRLVDGRTFD